MGGKKWRVLETACGFSPAGGRGRGVVSTANYEARKFGIHSAMPISQAFRLCPSAVFLPVDGELYTQVSENIMEIIRKKGFRVEQVSLDEACIDVSSLGSYERARELAKNLREEIQDKEHIVSTCGIGPNKMVAKIACEKAKPPYPSGILVVSPSEISSFLDPLGIEEIPGVGPKTAEKIRSFLKKERVTIADLKTVSQRVLTDIFGKNGESLYERIRGIDDSPVEEQEAKSYSKEHTFEKDTRDPEKILSVLSDIIKEMEEWIDQNKISFQTITVRCRFQGFETHTKARTLSRCSRSKKILKSEATKLLLRFILGNFKPVRLIGVRVDISGPRRIVRARKL